MHLSTFFFCRGNLRRVRWLDLQSLPGVTALGRNSCSLPEIQKKTTKGRKTTSSRMRKRTPKTPQTQPRQNHTPRVVHVKKAQSAGEGKSKGSLAQFVGKRAVEKAAPWKSPKTGLSPSA